MPEKYFIDDFTVRLLDVITELTKRDAMPPKKMFADKLHTRHDYLNKIERGERPFEEAKQTSAIETMYHEYGVRKSYWKDMRSYEVRVKDMFEHEPKKHKQSKKQKVPFTTYEKLLEENKQLKEKLKYYESLGIAAEPETKYLKVQPKKSDRNTDKNTDKIKVNKKKPKS